MNEKLFTACSAVGIAGSVIAEFLGGWDYGVQTLVIFMIIDFALGIACAVFWGKSDKSENGGLSSKACWRGIVKKCGTLLIVVCGAYLDKLLDVSYIRNALVIGFCTAELISICETAGVMGILPPAVQKILNKVIDILKGGNDDDNNSDSR